MFVDPCEIKLSEDAKELGRIQVLKAGTFHHAFYGTMEFNEKLFDEMIKNFNDKVRGTDIPVNYSHDAGGEAAGWITKLYQEDGNLYADVDWTKAAEEKISDKQFRYISAEFDFEYKDNESKKSFGATLLGAALTNIPFVKGMDKVLSEYQDLSDVAKKRFQELISIEEKDKSIMNFEDIKTAVSGLTEDQKKALAEGFGYVKPDEAGVKALQDENATLKKTIETQELEIKFSEMLANGKAVPSQKEAFLAGDMVKFAENAATTNDEPAGSGGNEQDDPKGKNEKADEDKPADEVTAETREEAEDKINKFAEKRIKEAKADGNVISFADAVSECLDEYPKLAEKYSG